MVLAILLEERHVANSVMSEAKIDAYGDATNNKALTQAIHEVFSVHLHDFWRKVDHNAIVDVTITLSQHELFFQRCQVLVVSIWPHDHRGVWREGDQDRLTSQLLRLQRQIVHEALVSCMNPVEVPNGNSDRFICY